MITYVREFVEYFSNEANVKDLMEFFGQCAVLVLIVGLAVLFFHLLSKGDED
jgi:hypothetical protein